MQGVVQGVRRLACMCLALRGALFQVLGPSTSECPETSLDASLARQPL
jgi:hypothetical protein